MDTQDELEIQKLEAVATLDELKRLVGYDWKGYTSTNLGHVMFASLKVEVKGKVNISLTKTSVSIHYKNADGETTSKRLIIPTGYHVDTVEKSKGVIDIDIVPEDRHYSLTIAL